jgi:hypothetical protein
MRSDLDWTVTGIGNRNAPFGTPGIELNLARFNNDFAWDHRDQIIGWCTVTNFVPSGKVASI